MLVYAKISNLALWAYVMVRSYLWIYIKGLSMCVNLTIISVCVSRFSYFLFPQTTIVL